MWTQTKWISQQSYQGQRMDSSKDVTRRNIHTPTDKGFRTQDIQEAKQLPGEPGKPAVTTSPPKVKAQCHHCHLTPLGTDPCSKARKKDGRSPVGKGEVLCPGDGLLGEPSGYNKATGTKQLRRGSGLYVRATF